MFAPPPQLDLWVWVWLYHGKVRTVCCHADMGCYGSFPPRARWSLSSCRARFFEAAAAGRGAHPVRQPVRRELGLVLVHGQVMSNDQVGDDFALAFELGRLGREALALI